VYFLISEKRRTALKDLGHIFFLKKKIIIFKWVTGLNDAHWAIFPKKKGASSWFSRDISSQVYRNGITWTKGNLNQNFRTLSTNKIGLNKVNLPRK